MRRWISVPLLLFVLLLNRRTVWLAIVIGVAVLMLRDRRLGRRALLLVSSAPLVTGWRIRLARGTPGARAGRRGPPSGSGNLDLARRGLVRAVSTPGHATPTDWAVGQPVGSGFTREVEGSEVTAIRTTSTSRS